MASGLLKRCRGCRKDKEVGEFHNDKSRRDGLSDTCKDCKRERWRRFSRENPNSNYTLRRGEIDKLRGIQAGACAGCNAEFGGDKEIYVDHDHSDGSTRGLLCRGCNSALGLVRDRPDTLRNLADYLENHEKKKQGLLT